jgi:hypothetical protein
MNVMRKCVLLCVVVVMFAGCDAKIETTVQPSQPAKSAVKTIEQRANGTQVSVTLRLSEAVVRPGDKFEVAVEMKIAPIWEIHPLAAQPAETATKLELITPEGIRAESEWIEPNTARSMGASGQPVHIGKAVFKRSLAVDSMAVGEHEIICKVGYQVCNEQQCLKPETLTLSVPLIVRE